MLVRINWSKSWLYGVAGSGRAAVTARGLYASVPQNRRQQSSAKPMFRMLPYQLPGFLVRLCRKQQSMCLSGPCYFTSRTSVTRDPMHTGVLSWGIQSSAGAGGNGDRRRAVTTPLGGRGWLCTGQRPPDLHRHVRYQLR